MAKTLRVAIENAAYSYDKLYDYLPPEGQNLCPGMRVLVPFGKGGDRILSGRGGAGGEKPSGTGKENGGMMRPTLQTQEPKTTA